MSPWCDESANVKSLLNSSDFSQNLPSSCIPLLSIYLKFHSKKVKFELNSQKVLNALDFLTFQNADSNLTCIYFQQVPAVGIKNLMLLIAQSGFSVPANDFSNEYKLRKKSRVCHQFSTDQRTKEFKSRTTIYMTTVSSCNFSRTACITPISF